MDEQIDNNNKSSNSQLINIEREKKRWSTKSIYPHTHESWILSGNQFFDCWTLSLLSLSRLKDKEIKKKREGGRKKYRRTGAHSDWLFI